MTKKPTKPKDAPPPAAPLREGVDYYIEAGLYVFTREFLLNRGHCCESKCRHCPYRDWSCANAKPEAE